MGGTHGEESDGDTKMTLGYIVPQKVRRREAKALRKENGDQEDDGQCYSPRSGPWSKDEHNRFIEAVRLYGKDWAKITKHVGSRTRALICSHS